MRVSEAMRLGAMLDEQGFGAFDRDGKTCAMWAAMKAVNRQMPIGWPEILKTVSACPACIYERSLDLYSVIVHLNDDHRWTREQIADWMDGIESDRVAPRAMEVVTA